MSFFFICCQYFSVLSQDAVTTMLCCSTKCTDLIGASCAANCTACCEFKSHALPVLSAEPVKILSPIALQQHASTGPVCGAFICECGAPCRLLPFFCTRQGGESGVWLLALLCAGFGVPTTLAAPPKAAAHAGETSMADRTEASRGRQHVGRGSEGGGRREEGIKQASAEEREQTRRGSSIEGFLAMGLRTW
jgi:hypothetical protein